MLRLDRLENDGGGEIVFYRNEFDVREIKGVDSKIETIYFQLKINNQTLNFISAYKSPNQITNHDFLEHL